MKTERQPSQEMPVYPVAWEAIIMKIQYLDREYPHGMALLRRLALRTLEPSEKGYTLYGTEVTVAEWSEMSLGEKEKLRSVFSWGKQPTQVFQEWIRELLLMTDYWQTTPTTIEVHEDRFSEFALV